MAAAAFFWSTWPAFWQVLTDYQGKETYYEYVYVCMCECVHVHACVQPGEKFTDNAHVLEFGCTERERGARGRDVERITTLII